ncbi:MAG: hypothetical protein HP490_05845 [Nitrospira sp.]|nr:hypothetical protein [Nitrospira sp.]
MSGASCDKHQLAGLDDRVRGFSRPVEFERAGESYRALLRYETVRVATELFPTQDAALLDMIHDQDFTEPGLSATQNAEEFQQRPVSWFAGTLGGISRSTGSRAGADRLPGQDTQLVPSEYAQE